MPQPLWKGHISFGLVNIPVTLYPGVTREPLDLDLIDQRDYSQVGYQKISKRTGRPVPKEDLVRAYEYEPGNYVVVTDQDLRRASPERTHRIEIKAFVDVDEIPPAFFDRPHFLEPEPKQEKGYVLLREALKESGLAALSTIVLRTREHLAALIARDRMLLLNLLRYPTELRDPAQLKLPGANPATYDVTPAELDMAKRLVKEMRTSWNPAPYRDEYREELLAFIRRKAEHGVTERVLPMPRPDRDRDKVIDIMTLLKRSLEAAGTDKPKRKRPRRKRIA